MNFRDVLCKDDCPEYNGFNTKRMRDMNMPSEPKTVVHYRPLLDMVLAEPDTMLTAVCDAMSISEQSGQEMTIFTPILDKDLHFLTPSLSHLLHFWVRAFYYMRK